MKALEPVVCYTCGKPAQLSDLGTGRECKECDQKRTDSYIAYMDQVEKYVSDQNITRNTKYRYWWSNGPWDSNQRLQRPPPAVLKEGPALGRKQLAEEMGRARVLNNTNYWRGEVYLARTGEKLKYPIEDIDMVLNPI
jgi:hypothetical protein